MSFSHRRPAISFMLLAGVLLSACGGDATAPAADAAPPEAALAISEAWVRVPPPGAPGTAGYAIFENRGAAPLQVVDLRSEAFGRSEIHDMLHEDGMMRMRRMETLDIAPGERVALAPGGKHLMLFEPTGDLAEGDTLRFEFRYRVAGEEYVTEAEAALRSR